jgi:uncharacterized protein
MTAKNLINKIAAEVKKELADDSSGHDWWHIWRVWQLAKRIGRTEKADMAVVELAALLHDIADWKEYGGDETVGPLVAARMLKQHRCPPETIEAVKTVVSQVSFKGAGVKTKPTTLEGKVVQDADRLDAIGAVGIGRTFAYGGSRGRIMYDPAIKPVHHATKGRYFKSQSPTVNHFYEKLLLLKGLMNTKTAKRLAGGRHEFMKAYLSRFFREWRGEA